MSRLILPALVLAAACTREAPRTAPPPAAPPPTQVAVAAAVEPAPSDPAPPLFDGSIYDLELPMRGENGEEMVLGDLRGHRTIIVMFYASCPAACPRLIADVQELEAKLAPQAREAVRIMFVSFDAARDTPERLRELRRDYRIDSPRWRFAAMTEGDARALGALLNVRYRELDSGEFFHTSVITLLDPDGRPLARVEGLGRDPGPILEQLAR
jgi:protein SCO1/2